MKTQGPGFGFSVPTTETENLDVLSSMPTTRERKSNCKRKEIYFMQKTTNTFIKEKRKYISHLAAAGMDDKTSRFSVSVVGTEKPKPGPCV